MLKKLRLDRVKNIFKTFEAKFKKFLRTASLVIYAVTSCQTNSGGLICKLTSSNLHSRQR